MKTKSLKKKSNEAVHLSAFKNIGKIDNRLLNGDFVDFSKNWTSFDLDWWNTLTAQIIDQQQKVVKVPVEKVKELFGSQKRHGSLKQFAKDSNETFKKFLAIQVNLEQISEDNSIYANTTLFDRSYINTKDWTFVVQIKKNALPYFNHLTNWTRYALEQSANLKSNYAKKLFLFLKQWRTIGKATFTIKDFRRKLAIPKSYRASNINERILKPCLEELAPYFMSLRVEKVYGKGKRGHRLSQYIFYWRPETKNPQEANVPRILQESKAIYSIMSNQFLDFDSKMRAVDRFRRIKVGTTKKYYQKYHPNTFFIEPEQGKERHSLLHRSALEGYKYYSEDTLVGLCNIYEQMNRQGLLKGNDLSDLAILETRLFDKHMDSMARKSSLKVEVETIAGKLVNNHHFDGKSSYDLKKIKKEIEVSIQENFAKDKRGQKHHPSHQLEFRFE